MSKLIETEALIVGSGLYTLHKRPSFTGRGTDATSYSWFVWERGGPAA